MGIERRRKKKRTNDNVGDDDDNAALVSIMLQLLFPLRIARISDNHVLLSRGIIIIR